MVPNLQILFNCRQVVVYSDRNCRQVSAGNSIPTKKKDKPFYTNYLTITLDVCILLSLATFTIYAPEGSLLVKLPEKLSLTTG